MLIFWVCIEIKDSL